MGVPALRPFPAALTSYGKRLATATDAHYLILALAFMAGRPVIGVLVPMVTLATYHASAYANRQFAGHQLWKRYGAPCHRWLADKQSHALQFNAVSEISLGFLTLLSMLGPGRSISQLYVTWSVLKQRYKSPDSAPQHRVAWQTIDERVRPYYSRVSFVHQLIQKAKAWFTA
jgi:hypothetical protein